MKFSDFEEAGRAVLEFLHARIGFDLWMLTRVEGDDWIVLQSEDHGYGVEPGTVFQWADSFCCHMVANRGPRVAPKSDLIPEYAAAPIGRQAEIKAYVGIPLEGPDGETFGTLCAIHPAAQPDSIVEEKELVELLGGLLSTLLSTELAAAEDLRRAERLEAEALSDALTGVYNRGGWNTLLAAEEERCRRFGHPAAVLIVDLDDLKLVNDTRGHAAGDEVIRRAAAALQKVARSLDIVARLGGDEFGILAVECNLTGAEALVERLEDALAEAGAKASVGFAMRDPAVGLQGACDLADRRMYERKRPLAPGAGPAA